jgi:hypothetical protein
LNRSVIRASAGLAVAAAAVCLGVILIVGGIGCQSGDVPALEAARVCRQFAEYKNAGDPKADDLLEPAPELPTEPVSAEEADRLDAQLMLRGQFRVKDVRPLKVRGRSGSDGASRFVLVAEGGLDSQTFRVRTPTGSEPHQRILYNPDITVEVRDGKIRGLHAGLHRD